MTEARRPDLGENCLRATWINHATFLIEGSQGNVLTDPIFSPCCGPLGRIGPLRAHRPGIALAGLPPIHVVLLSHDHYDHCDLPSLRRIAADHDPIAIAPLGNQDLLEAAGFRRIITLDWWQNHSPAPNLSVTVTPARHWSKRLGRPRFTRLWGGFHIQMGSARLQFVGDTGYHPELFREIRQRLEPPDIALVPIGAYEPRWFMQGQHCNPAEAVKIHLDLGARTSLAMHWGTFQLTDEGREEPPAALQTALQTVAPKADFRLLEPGEHVVIAN